MLELDSNKLIYLIITTEFDKKSAHGIANQLLRENLIPCVTFRNVQSLFWWKGEINQSKEVQLIIKCKEENLNKVCKKITQLHSYELPEIIFFPVSANLDYCNWVNSF